MLLWEVDGAIRRRPVGIGRGLETGQELVLIRSPDLDDVANGGAVDPSGSLKRTSRVLIQPHISCVNDRNIQGGLRGRGADNILRALNE